MVTEFFLSAYFQLIINALDRISWLEWNLLELVIQSWPKLFSEDNTVIEGIAGSILHLFLQDTIELFNSIIDYLFLLAFELFLKLHCKFVDSSLSPFFLVCNVSDIFSETLQGLGFKVFDFFQIFIFTENIASIIQEFSKAIIRNEIRLL